MLSQLRGRQHSRVIDLHAPTTVVWTLQHNTVQRALNLHITVTDRYLECCGLVTVPRPKATLSANGADADAPNDVPTFALMSTAPHALGMNRKRAAATPPAPHGVQQQSPTQCVGLRADTSRAGDRIRTCTDTGFQALCR